MKYIKNISAISLVLLAISCNQTTNQNIEFDGNSQQMGVVVIGDDTISVEIADTPPERAQGLMYRNDLPAGQGMLFIFEQAGYHSFWMKNTLIPLDIIWIADDKIVHIESDVPSAGDEMFPPTYQPDKPATHVLEVNGGTVDKLDWKVGDQ